MTTPEQQARQILGRMKVEHADYYSAGDLVELANLIAENAALKAELAAINGAGEPVAWANLGDLISAKNGRERYGNQGAPDMHTWSEGGPSNYHDTPLYTRPAVPLTDEQIVDLVRDVGLDWQSGWTLDECEPNRYVQLSRAIEAHIKGA